MTGVSVRVLKSLYMNTNPHHGQNRLPDGASDPQERQFMAVHSTTRRQHTRSGVVRSYSPRPWRFRRESQFQKATSFAASDAGTYNSILDLAGNPCGRPRPFGGRDRLLRSPGALSEGVSNRLLSSSHEICHFRNTKVSVHCSWARPGRTSGVVHVRTTCRSRCASMSARKPS